MKNQTNASNGTATQGSNAASAAEAKTGFLASLTYAVVSKTTAESKPRAAVRQNGQVVFSAAANKIIGFAQDKPETHFYRAGADKDGNIYLVPAKAGEENVLKATKNNDSMQFRQDNVFEGLGAKLKDSYIVSEGIDGEGDKAVKYFKLTKQSKAEAAADDKAAGTDAAADKK